LKTYETVFVLDPDLPEEDTEKSVSKLEGVIESQKGKLVFTERWGKRKFAYRVKKKLKGNYFRTMYYGEGNVVTVLERNLRLMEEVFKFLTIKLSDTEIEVEDKKEDVERESDTESTTDTVSSESSEDEGGEDEGSSESEPSKED
jgi:small subunit ribosomal protein S6